MSDIGYGQAFEPYWQAQWRGILPLERPRKDPPPSNYTGYAGIDPSYPDILAWAEQRPNDNLCLRLPDGVVGIDVDGYGAKTGAAAFAEAETRWGALPPTARSTSREDDPISGIRLYRVPAGTLLEHVIAFPELGIGDIEVIQHHHRYVVCWPSIHPEGRPYWWVNDDNQLISVPEISKLPWLPSEWISKLRVTRSSPSLNGAHYDVKAALTPGEPSPSVASRLSQAVMELSTPGQSRHDTTMRHVLALLRMGKNGQPGVHKALQGLQRVFTATVSADGSRSVSEADAEFVRFVTNTNAARELAQPGLLDWMRKQAVDDKPTENGQSVTDDEQRDLHEVAVKHKAYELQVLDEARALWNRQRTALMGQQPPKMVSMSDFLAVPDEDTRYRVEGLLPIGARILLAAQYKAGKTSLIANLLRCLVDGDRFLGKFTVNPIERVLLIDTELYEGTLRRWLREQTIRNVDGINIMCLRGRLASFAITDDRIRAEWAQRISGAQLIMLDCLRPCLDALGLSEDKEAGVFLTAFDALCREAGADEAVVVHHMGHSEERSRGDSRLLDWPDALWKLVRDTDDDGGDIENGDRFFSAIGRDVSVDESQLNWQPETRMLTICGGTRVDKKAQGIIGDIVEIMSDPLNADGLSYNQLVAKLKLPAYGGHGRNIARAAVFRAASEGVLLVSTGPRNSNIHILNPSHRGGTNDDQ